MSLVVRAVRWLEPRDVPPAQGTGLRCPERAQAALAARFGVDWQGYAATTPRWIGVVCLRVA